MSEDTVYAGPERRSEGKIGEYVSAVKKVGPLINWLKGLVGTIIVAAFYLGMGYQRLGDRMDRFEATQLTDHALIMQQRQDFNDLQKERRDMLSSWEHRMTNVESKVDSLIDIGNKVATRLGVQH